MPKKFYSVILIDDDEITNYLNQRVLEQTHIAEEVKVFLNGKEALDYFKTLDKSQLNEILVFLDLNMPVMDGWEFLNSYTEISLPKEKIHIYILSTSKNPDDYNHAKEYTSVVEGYINKPLSSEILKRIFQI